MNKMYDIVEKCLVEIEQGADVDTVLFRYPELADELRPILETAVKAMNLASSGPSLAMTHIHRMKLLQHAAQLREAKVKRTSRFWTASLRRVAVTFIVLITLFTSGNGLVRASSTTIPGDNLYPVKRTWEDMLVLFAFNPQYREELEFKQENERLDELNELFTKGRSAKVDFAGYVTSLTETEWRVSGIIVLITPQTVLPAGNVPVGAAVRILGVTQSNMTVLSEKIEILPMNTKLPEIKDDEPEVNQEDQTGTEPSDEQETPTGSVLEAPLVEITNTPEDKPESSNTGTESNDSESDSESPSTATPKAPVPQATATKKTEFENRSVSFRGVVQSVSGSTWTVGGRVINVTKAEINGKPMVGATAKVEGYYNANGVFIAKNIEVLKSSDDSKSGQKNDNGQSSGETEH